MRRRLICSTTFASGEVSHHDLFPELFGIPIDLAYLEDHIFESMPVDECALWPEQFLSAIPEGADLSKVGHRLVWWLLQGEDSPISEFKDEPHIKTVADLIRTRF